MISDFLKKNIKSQASFVEYGYGQVEPNHLSAQRTGQIYAQLPAAADIDVLENGQFVKYDYLNETVNFSGAGEWMLVYNEIKLYREHQLDCEFAMVKDNYNARVYSPMDGVKGTDWLKQSRHYNATRLDENGKAQDIITYVDGVPVTGNTMDINGKTVNLIEDVTAKPDMYELHYNEDPFHFEGRYSEKMMPEGTKMVPRVFKTNVGDIFTTNTVNLDIAGTVEDLMGKELSPNEKGILSENGDGTMKWQVVKVYTMPDRQKGVKIMRIA